MAGVRLFSRCKIEVYEDHRRALDVICTPRDLQKSYTQVYNEFCNKMAKFIVHLRCRHFRCTITFNLVREGNCSRHNRPKENHRSQCCCAAVDTIPVSSRTAPSPFFCDFCHEQLSCFCHCGSSIH